MDSRGRQGQLSWAGRASDWPRIRLIDTQAGERSRAPAGPVWSWTAAERLGGENESDCPGFAWFCGFRLAAQAGR